jgi:hypothetical protein
VSNVPPAEASGLYFAVDSFTFSPRKLLSPSYKFTMTISHESNGGNGQTNGSNGHESNGTDGDTNAASKPSNTFPEEVPNICSGSTKQSLSLFNLTGKTALITGGNGGIGGGMARGLAEAGADIIIFQIPGEVSKFPAKLSLETGRKVSVYDCDMAENPSIRAAVAKVIADGLEIDILCNCAGMSSGSVPALIETDEHKDKV